MLHRRCSFVAGITALFLAHSSPAQISKANQIFINRGLQVAALAVPYDNFHLNTLSNANYTSAVWTWDSPRSYNNMSSLGPAPGFPWGRWASDENDMPPLGGESPYLSQLIYLQLADEWNLNDDSVRTRAVNWFNSVHTNWPNTILAANNWGGQIADSLLIDFVSRAHPDMICFDTYPWQSVWDANAPNHIGAIISGPPTGWYGYLRVYRDISRAFNIPFGNYVQTFHSVQDYNNTVYRDPSPSELRLNHSGALAFNSKMLIDFVYNNGASSLFTAPGGDTTPNALYYEKVDCALRARNLGKALVRLKPIDEATGSWTTSVMFVRGRNSGGTLNPIPINFYAGPGGTNPNTDWVADRNDPWLRGWVVTNTGNKNNGQPGDVIVAWFKLLDESFDGPNYNNEIYFVVVNGLTDPTGTAADCSQEIKLNFLNTFSSVEMLNPQTANVEAQTLPIVSTRRQLTLNLNGGDAALFKISDGAPFVGAEFTGAPVITVDPANQTSTIGSDATFTAAATGSLPISYRWLFEGATIPGATTNSYTRTNVHPADAGDYSMVASNSFGSVTSAVATLTVMSNLSLFYEPFDYPNVGVSVSSNTPGNWTLVAGVPVNDCNVASGSLAYPGLAAPAGNSITNGGDGYAMRRLLGTNFSSGAVYFSVLFRMNNIGTAWTSGSTPAQVASLTTTNNTSFRAQIMVKTNNSSSYVFGVQKGGTGSITTLDTTSHNLGETVFLVGKYDFNVTPNPVTLWINPLPNTFGTGNEPASGFITSTAGLDFNGTNVIDRFNFRQNTAASVPAAMQWDELRVGNSWASVTPPGPLPVVILSNLVRLADGRVQFAYTNTSGFAGTVYASTNLTNWSLVGTAEQISPGLFQFTDVEASNYVHRFYQLRWP